MTPDRDTSHQRRPLSDQATIWGSAAAVATAVIALLAWLLPTGGSGSNAGQDATGTPATSPTAGRSAGGTGPISTFTGASVSDTVVLTDIVPESGAINLGRSDSPGVLDLPCPTNQSNDRSRTVSYDLLGAYHGLTGLASVSGFSRAEAKAEVEVLVDDVRVDNKVFAPGEQAPLAATLDGAQRVAIRITCGQSDGTVTISAARLSR